MYRLELTHRAQSELDEFGGEDLERVVTTIQKLCPGSPKSLATFWGNLKDEPRPQGVRKLRGSIYRIRVGDWRVIYAVFDKDRLVVVGKIVRRSERIYDKVDELF